MHGYRRLRRVVDDDDEDDAEDAANKRVGGGICEMRRSPRLASTQATASASDTVGGAREQRKRKGESARILTTPSAEESLDAQPAVGAPRKRAATAQSIAQQMRMPTDTASASASTDVEATRLPSRQAVCIDMVELQKDLLIEGKRDQAARVGRAVLTLTELLSIVERS